MNSTVPTQERLISQLRKIVGEAHVLVDGDLSAWEQDWRRRVRGNALAVVRPGSTSEVVAIVKICAAAGATIVPQGGNTGMVGGATPDVTGQQVVLSLGRMRAVRKLDSANLTITVEAGCVLETLQETVWEAGHLFPLSMAAEGSCTIGGNLATNAGGTQVLRYGNARELCIGIEVVTAEGEVWSELNGLRKDNTGYDLRDLFVGSEGTLGIITAATMKLFPQPAASLTAWAAVPSVDAAVALLKHARNRLDAGLTGFEIMGGAALALVSKHMPQLRIPLDGSTTASYAVLMEFASSTSEDDARERLEGVLEFALEEGYAQDVVVAENLSQAATFWHVRESIPLAQAEEGPNIKHDISLPVSNLAEFVAYTSRLLHEKFPTARLINFGHLGDGNLHYNIQAPSDADMHQFIHCNEREINDEIYRAVEKFGGSFSAEHGIGQFKIQDLEQYKSPVALRMMSRIKHALDPHNFE